MSEEKSEPVICRLCRAMPAIKSHIIPKSFFLGDETTRLIPTKPGSFTRRTPVGVYSRLLCAACDRHWGKLDEYAAHVLALGESKKLPHTIALGYPVPYLNYSYARLHTFFMTVLWRALHSPHPYFERLQHPDLRSRLDAIVLEGDQDLADEHRILFSHFPDVPWRGSIQPILRQCNWGNRTFDAALFVINNLHVTITYGPTPAFPWWEVLNKSGHTLVVPIKYQNSYVAQAFEGMHRNYPSAFKTRVSKKSRKGLNEIHLEE